MKVRYSEEMTQWVEIDVEGLDEDSTMEEIEEASREMALDKIQNEGGDGCNVHESFFECMVEKKKRLTLRIV
jgi:hypothetical protein